MRLSRFVIAGASVAAGVIASILVLTAGNAGGRTEWPTSSLRDLTKLTKLSGTVAPPLTLTDQHGQRRSVSSLRGRVVVFESMDPECALECPLMAQEFVDAARDLGKRSAQVMLVAVNVNQFHARTADVLQFSRQHHLEQLPNWAFLTGSTAALRQVWHAYRIVVIPKRTGDVTHSDLMYFIDPRGLARWVAAPDYNQAAIPQWGAAIADVANRLVG
jgi:cytochrome oxidase Cu insertion factor (SCO1/SenC/PrrC family)